MLKNHFISLKYLFLRILFLIEYYKLLNITMQNKRTTQNDCILTNFIIIRKMFIMYFSQFICCVFPLCVI